MSVNTLNGLMKTTTKIVFRLLFGYKNNNHLYNTLKSKHMHSQSKKSFKEDKKLLKVDRAFLTWGSVACFLCLLDVNFSVIKKKRKKRHCLHIKTKICTHKMLHFYILNQTKWQYNQTIKISKQAAEKYLVMMNESFCEFN